MPTVVRAVLAVVAGFLAGSVVNMGLIMVSGSVIAPPAGADTTTMEGLRASLHLFEPKHFVFPFLAHALGTFAGALVAVLLAPAEPLTAACGVGGLFLLGGIANIVMLPSPLWFTVVDLLLAYLPMAWLALQVVRRRTAAAGSTP